MPSSVLQLPALSCLAVAQEHKQTYPHTCDIHVLLVQALGHSMGMAVRAASSPSLTCSSLQHFKHGQSAALATILSEWQGACTSKGEQLKLTKQWLNETASSLQTSVTAVSAV